MDVAIDLFDAGMEAVVLAVRVSNAGRCVRTVPILLAADDSAVAALEVEQADQLHGRLAATRARALGIDGAFCSHSDSIGFVLAIVIPAARHCPYDRHGR